MRSTIRLGPNNPYSRYLRSEDGISVHQWLGHWRVVWRDFYSVKQDLEFDHETEARACAHRVLQYDVNQDLIDLSDEEIVEQLRWWSQFT